MKLAMKAASKIKHGHTMYVEIITATRTNCYSRPQTGNEEQHHPDPDSSEHGSVCRRYAVNNPYGWNVDQDNAEEEFTSSTNKFKGLPVFRYICRGFIHSTPPFMFARTYKLEG